MEDVAEISLADGKTDSDPEQDRLPSPVPLKMNVGGGSGGGKVAAHHRGFEEITTMDDDRFDVSMPPVREGWPVES